MMMFLYLMGWLSFSLKRKHVLLMLLSLEFLVLILFYGLMMYFSMNFFENYFNLIYLSFSVCEGALGLSLLVLMIRSHGNDYFNNLNILW